MLKYVITTLLALCAFASIANAQVPPNRMATDVQEPEEVSATATDPTQTAPVTTDATEQAPAKPVKEPAQPTSQNKPEKHREMGLDIGLGGGGFFSEGTQSGAMLITASIGYRFDESWQLGLAWDAKLQPWATGQSMFHTVGLGLRWRFYEGLYSEARLGPAFSRISINGFEQSKFGVGWGFRLGYLWMPHPTVGLNAALLTNMRYVDAFYADLGAVLGVQFHF